MTRRELFPSFLALATALLSLSALASLVWFKEDNDDYEGTMAQLDQAYAPKGNQKDEFFWQETLWSL
jgi:hypothetical protein